MPNRRELVDLHHHRARLVEVVEQRRVLHAVVREARAVLGRPVVEVDDRAVLGVRRRVETFAHADPVVLAERHADREGAPLLLREGVKRVSARERRAEARRVELVRRVAVRRRREAAPLESRRELDLGLAAKLFPHVVELVRLLLREVRFSYEPDVVGPPQGVEVS